MGVQPVHYSGSGSDFSNHAENTSKYFFFFFFFIRKKLLNNEVKLGQINHSGSNHYLCTFK